MRMILTISFLVVVVGLIVYTRLHQRDPQGATAEPPAMQSPPPTTASPVLIPHAERLMAQMGRLPTPEEQREEARIDAEQVRQAEQSLDSPEAEDRLAAVEQLAAYPTPESESLLVGMLNTDIDATVRNMVAQSLDSFDKLSNEAISALLLALGDPNEEVRASALTTLEEQASKETAGSKRFRKIIAGLKKSAASRRIAKDTRDAIRELLVDLVP